MLHTLDITLMHVQILQITEIWDVTSLETTYKGYEEFQRDLKAYCLEEQKENKNDNSEVSKVNVPKVS